MGYIIDIEKLKQKKKEINDEKAKNRNEVEVKLYKYIIEEFKQKGYRNSISFEQSFLDNKSGAIFYIEVPLYDMYEYNFISSDKHDIILDIIKDEDFKSKILKYVLKFHGLEDIKDISNSQQIKIVKKERNIDVICEILFI